MRPVTPYPNWHLTTKQTLDYICGDFESSWDAIANVAGDTISRGNFVFMMQAMTLLEVVSRVYVNQGLNSFSENLNLKNRLYFKRFPKPTYRDNPASFKYRHDPHGQFFLPAIVDEKGKDDAPLIGILFYLIRNGLMHTYQQSFATLGSNSQESIGFSLTGPGHLEHLRVLRTSGHQTHHLTYSEFDRVIWLKISPGILFLDIKEALLATNNMLPHFDRLGYCWDVSVSNLCQNGFLKTPTK